MGTSSPSFKQGIAELKKQTKAAMGGVSPYIVLMHPDGWAQAQALGLDAVSAPDYEVMARIDQLQRDAERGAVAANTTLCRAVTPNAHSDFIMLVGGVQGLNQRLKARVNIAALTQIGGGGRGRGAGV